MVRSLYLIRWSVSSYEIKTTGPGLTRRPQEAPYAAPLLWAADAAAASANVRYDLPVPPAALRRHISPSLRTASSLLSRSAQSTGAGCPSGASAIGIKLGGFTPDKASCACLRASATAEADGSAASSAPINMLSDSVN